MIQNLKTGVIFACFLGMPASVEADQNSSKGRHGTYTLTDRPGYKKAIGLPFCEAAAEKILDRWRGTLVIKYSDRAVTVNAEQWIFVDNEPLPNAVARRPPDSSINGRIEVWFSRRYQRGGAQVVYSDENRKCTTAIEFNGKWSEP